MKKKRPAKKADGIGYKNITLITDKADIIVRSLYLRATAQRSFLVITPRIWITYLTIHRLRCTMSDYWRA